jgi:hypothetical protein
MRRANDKPLTDLLQGFRKQRCWHATEKLVVTVIRTLCFEVLPGRCVCGAAEGRCFTTDRISAAELAEMCGDDLSRRSVQRALVVLAKKAGVITVHRKKRDDDPSQNERNTYTFHPARWLEWNGQERPAGWEPDAPTSEPAPPVRAQMVEAARIAAGRPPFDPVASRLARRAARLDKREPNAYRAQLAAAARVAKVEAEVAEFKAALAAELPPAGSGDRKLEGGGDSFQPPAPKPSDPRDKPTGAIEVSPPPRGVTPSPGDAPPTDLVVWQGPRALVTSAGEPIPSGSALTLPHVEDLDPQILDILHEYSPLHPLAMEQNARMIGDTARKYGVWFGLVRIALERLALKIQQGKARPDIALARAFVKRQWPIAHPEIALPPRPEEPELEELGFSAEELLALGPAAADEADPTHEELAAMRALALLAPTKPTGADVFHLALDALRQHAPKGFELWFTGVQFDGLAHGLLHLRARNDFVVRGIPVKMLERLSTEIRRLVGTRITVQWTIDPDLTRPLASGPPPPSPAKPRRR